MPRSAHGRSLRIFALIILAAAAAGAAESPALPAAERTRAEITTLLTNFLSPEQNPTRAAHERFWADDLVYTSSAGKVTNKAEILASFDEAPAAVAQKTAEPEPVYSAEDILVRPYGEMAALTFRLVARAPDGTTQFYRNSGTFLRRNGQWQAITWQATRVPAPAAAADPAAK